MRSTPVTVSAPAGEPRLSLTQIGLVEPAGVACLPRVGVPWSPKLVKVSGARPCGAVRNSPGSGVVPSCTAAYAYPVPGRSPVRAAWWMKTSVPDCASRYVVVSASTLCPYPSAGEPRYTRGRATCCGVLQETTTSRAASAPNCRCSPCTSGAPLAPGGVHSSGEDGAAMAGAGSSAAPVRPAAPPRIPRRLTELSLMDSCSW